MNRNEKDVLLSTNAINAIDRVIVRFVSLTSLCEWMEEKNMEEKNIDGWGRVKKNQRNKRICGKTVIIFILNGLGI